MKEVKGQGREEGVRRKREGDQEDGEKAKEAQEGSEGRVNELGVNEKNREGRKEDIMKQNKRAGRMAREEGREINQELEGKGEMGKGC